MREELKLRLEWAVGMLHAIRRADDIVFARLIAQGGIDLATADEEAMREAGNQEALESLADARAKDSNPPQEERSDPLGLAAADDNRKALVEALLESAGDVSEVPTRPVGQIGAVDSRKLDHAAQVMRQAAAALAAFQSRQEEK